MNLTVSLGLLAVSAPFGLFLAVRHLRGGNAPWGAAIAHLVFGAAGLVTLGWLVAASGFSGMGAVALGIVTVAALGGLVMFVQRLKATRPPAALIVVHALAAVAGVGVLALAIFRH